MRDEDGGRPAGRLQDALEDLRLAPDVELGGGLVEQHDARPLPHRGEGPGQGHALPLAAGQLGPAVVAAGEDGVEAGEVRRPRLRQRVAHDRLGRAGRGDVVGQRQLEAREVLEHRGDARAPRREVELAQVHAVHLDGARLRLVEPAQQLGEGSLAGAVPADDGERRAGGQGQVEPVEDGSVRPGGIGEAHAREADLAPRPVPRRLGAEGQRAARRHRLAQPQHRRGGRPRAVEGPRQATEGDHAGRGGGARERHEAVEGQRAGGDVGGQRPEHDGVGGEDDGEARRHRALAQPRRRPAQVVQPPPVAPEPVDGPAGEAEQPQLLGRRRVHGQPVRVVGVPLGFAHRLGLAVLPDPALAQQPVRRQPRAAEHQRGPPRVGEEEGAGGQPGQQLDEARRDEVHRDEQGRSADAEVEVARHGQVARELGVLEVPDAGRLDAGHRQLVVEPGGGGAAEVGARGAVQRRQHLQQDEHRADAGERPGEAAARLDGAQEDPHRDRQQGRQEAAHHEGAPPDRGQERVGAGQDGEELPLGASAEASDRGHEHRSTSVTLPAARSRDHHRCRSRSRRRLALRCGPSSLDAGAPVKGSAGYNRIHVTSGGRAR